MVNFRRIGNSNVVIEPSADAIQEFKVESNNFSAEYGYCAGAIVDATINSSNQFHRDAFEFLRNDRLDARDFPPALVHKADLQRTKTALRNTLEPTGPIVSRTETCPPANAR